MESKLECPFEPVRLTDSSPEDLKARDRAWSHSLWLWALIGIVWAQVLATRYFPRSAGLADVFRWVLPVIVVISVFVVLKTILQRLGLSVLKDGGSDGPASARIRLCGALAAGRYLEQETRGIEFEPVVFRLRDTSHARAPRRLFVAYALALVLVAGVLIRFVGVSIWAVGAVVFISLDGWLLFVAFAFPVYVRVSPGTLELMRFGVWGRGNAILTRFNLREGAIDLGIRGSVALRGASFCDADRLIIGHRQLAWHGREFGRAVLAAARSTTSTPDLPRDALIG